MSKVRIEYLYADIDNERKLKWLENAKFLRVAEDYEVVDFSFEEYLFRLRKEMQKFTDSTGDITLQKQQESYENWKERSHSDIFSLDGSSIRWDNSIVHSLAIYLASHPLALPYFLEENAVNIAGLFLGESLLANSMALAPQFGYEEFKLWEAQPISEKNYRARNFEAKYKLSLFLGVLDELLELGVNISEFSFVDLRKVNTFADTHQAPFWNEKLISTMNASTYRRCDGIKFEEKELLEFIQFQDIPTFLDSIMHLVDSEYYVHFMEEAVTMNPKSVVALPYFHTTNMDFIEKESLVEIKVLCEAIKNKLREVKHSSEIKVLKRKIEGIRKRLSEKVDNKDFDYSEILKELETLYQEILFSHLKEKEELLTLLKKLIEEKHLDVVVSEETSQEECSKEDDTKIDFVSKMQELDRRVDGLENRVSTIEKQLLSYVQNGGVIPTLPTDTVSREEIIRLILEYRPVTFKEKLRRLEVLKLLKVGTIGTLLGGLLFISGSSSTILDNSATIVPTLPIIVEEIKPSTLSPESLDESTKPVEETSTPSLPVEKEPKVTLKPLEEIVREVIRGNFGDGQVRREALEEAGYDFITVQSYVNYVIENNVPFNQLRPVEEIIREVANGEWGEGEEMITRLRTIGYDYEFIKEFVEEVKKSQSTDTNSYK